MKNLLIEACEEIVRLHRENELLGAKVEMIELFACVLHAKPAIRSQGMAEDIAWKLQREIAALQDKT